MVRRLYAGVMETNKQAIEAARRIKGQLHNHPRSLSHVTHVGEKAVVRYEVWCDNCPWTYEDSSKVVASSAAVQHEEAHRG